MIVPAFVNLYSKTTTHKETKHKPIVVKTKGPIDEYIYMTFYQTQHFALHV